MRRAVELGADRERVLRAAMDRVVPGDDFPSAWEAGAGDYLARRLGGELAAVAEVFLAGLDALDEEARTRHGSGFDALGAREQDEVLGCVEAGDVVAPWHVDPREFFETLVGATVEGYYSDPGNGGNRGAVSWSMVGFARCVPGEGSGW